MELTYLQNAIFPCNLCHAADSHPPPCLTHSPYLHQKTKSALRGKNQTFHVHFIRAYSVCKAHTYKGNINKLHFLHLQIVCASNSLNKKYRKKEHAFKKSFNPSSSEIIRTFAELTFTEITTLGGFNLYGCKGYWSM